jgi:HAD superfamily hydrolase (TIGR01459 family)
MEPFAPNRIVTNLRTIAGHYDGFIIDLWGVIHNGNSPFPGAAETLSHLRAKGAKVCLLSNSPRLQSNVASKLGAMGIGGNHYDHLVTSGELTLEAIRNPPDAWHKALGSRCLHIGPEHGFGLLGEIASTCVEHPKDANFILCTGTRTGETLQDYGAILAECAGLRLPMLCANPDLIVHVEGRLAVCAGSLAQHYQTLGGAVRYHGKPHPPAYERCLSLLGQTVRSVLAIGDAFHTDMAGARAAGIDAAFIAGGIHRNELAVEWGEMPSPSKLSALFKASRMQPRFVMSHLGW